MKGGNYSSSQSQDLRAWHLELFDDVPFDDFLQVHHNY